MPKNTTKSASPSEKHSHDITSVEEESIRTELLSWYDKNKRDLPWRNLYASSSEDHDLNKRGYAVWVSEIMLQQTQVATVIDYYNRWMAKWPTLQDLAAATMDEVNEVWSGLGYYSRARRLFEACNKVCKEHDGNLPTSATALQKTLSGVGRYTAGAIASIAFNEPTGVVDGNVIRVLSRLRIIGADSTSNNTNEKYWQLANSLVDKNRPGDFNQALMELGATVCTPKNPQCKECCVRDQCMAYEEVEEYKKTKGNELLSTLSMVNKRLKPSTTDIEDCDLCLKSTWDPLLGVCNYPTKPKKKEAKQEMFGVCLIRRNSVENESQFLIVQRPENGLLAGLWEFPNIKLNTETKDITTVEQFIHDEINLSIDGKLAELGEVIHKFSHCHHTYKIYHSVFPQQDVTLSKTAISKQPLKWISREEFSDAAVSTAMRKIFRVYEDSWNKNNAPATKKRKLNTSKELKSQRTMDSFFKKK